jgi:E3 ubiquitin-protein ligase BRE1
MWKKMASDRLKELETLRLEQGKLRGQLANAAGSGGSGPPANGNEGAFVKGHVLYVQAMAHAEAERSAATKCRKELDASRKDLEQSQKDLQRCVLYKEKAQKDLKSNLQAVSQQFAAHLQKLTDKCDKLQTSVDEGLEAKRQLAQKEESLQNMKDAHKALMDENGALQRVANIRARQVEMDLKQGQHQKFRGDLTKEIESKKARVQANAQSAERATEGNARLQDHLNDLVTMVDLLSQSHDSCKSELTLCKEDLEGSRMESEALLPEIDSVTSTYEDLRRQCTKLRDDLGKKEDVYLKLTSQHYKAKQMQAIMEDEKAAMKETLGKQELLLATHAEALTTHKRELTIKDKKLLTLQTELQRLMKEMRIIASSAEDKDKARSTASEELRWLKADHEKLKGNSLALGAEAEDSKHKMKRAEEDAMKLKQKVAKLEKVQGKLKRQSSSASSGGTDNEEALIATISELKKKVYCSFASDKNNKTNYGEEHIKDCCLPDCGHAFSRVSINKLIAIRSRKCPMCGTRFSDGKIQDIFLG